MGIRVKAVRRFGWNRYVGFFEKLREHGEVFEIPKREYFSPRWMEPADEEAKKALGGFAKAEEVHKSR